MSDASAASAPRPVYLCTDERMLRHGPIDWTPPPPCQDEDPPSFVFSSFPRQFQDCPVGYVFENPQRLEILQRRMQQLQERLMATSSAGPKEGEQRDNEPNAATTKAIFLPLGCKLATKDDILLAHHSNDGAAYWDKLAAISQWTNDECVQAGKVDADMYYCRDTFAAARLACGGVLNCVRAVVMGDTATSDTMTTAVLSTSTNTATTSVTSSSSATPLPCRHALALVRPPGHHACQAQEMGFCFLNSVAVAAKHAVDVMGLARVLILDFDVHHGNGTQDLTLEDDRIFYISLHRYQLKPKNRPNSMSGFFPYLPSGNYTETGTDGTNCNVAWTHPQMGNAEYAAALCELVLPLIAEYGPDLILISCGLDAARGDLLGDCELTPDFYHAMTRSVLLAAGEDVPVVAALEGGYTLHVIADCMEAVALALMNRDFEKLEDDDDGRSVVERNGGGGTTTYSQNNGHRPDPFIAQPELVASLATASSDGDDNYSNDEAVKSTTALELQKARNVLKDYYDYDATNCSSSNQVKASAIRNINRSIGAMQACERWNDVPLRTLSAAVSARSNNKTTTSASSTSILPTRQSARAAARKKKEADESAAVLADALQSLSLQG